MPSGDIEGGRVTGLTDRAGFLVSQLGFWAVSRFSERLAPLGLQPRHFGLLSHLAAAEGQTQQQLADRMGIHRNVMVGLVDDLERRGLVERRRHPTDRRAHALHLTTGARHKLAQAGQVADEHDDDVLAPLDPRERSQMIGYLQRLIHREPLAPGVHLDLPGGHAPEPVGYGPAAPLAPVSDRSAGGAPRRPGRRGAGRP